MSPSCMRVLSWGPFAGLVLLVACCTHANANAGDIYFVERQVSSTMPRDHAGFGGGFESRSALKNQANGVNRLLRTDDAGGTPTVVFETSLAIVGFSPSSDGTRLVCHLQEAAGQQSKSSPPASQIVVLDRSGAVEHTIDLSGLGVRVYGSPVLLPDKKHIGLTVCKPLDEAAEKKRKEQPRPTGPPKVTGRPGPRPPDTQSIKEKFEQIENTSEGARAFGGATYIDQPYVATIDLDGRNLKQISPGAMPCWSPDGKTILFTAVTVAKPGAIPGPSRLSVMKSDGTEARPVAAAGTWDGWFSPEGKKIVYLSIDERLESAVMTANADGTGASRVKLPASSYASPRWVDEGKMIVFGSRPEALNKPGVPSAQYPGPNPIRTIWLSDIDGSGLRRVSPQATALVTFGIDLDSEMVLLHQSKHPSHGAAGAGSPVQSLPSGSTVEQTGQIYYLRDAAGHRTPLRDGTYQLPDGTILHVKAGHRVAD